MRRAELQDAVDDLPIVKMPITGRHGGKARSLLTVPEPEAKRHREASHSPVPWQHEMERQFSAVGETDEQACVGRYMTQKDILNILPGDTVGGKMRRIHQEAFCIRTEDQNTGFDRMHHPSNGKA